MFRILIPLICQKIKSHTRSEINLTKEKGEFRIVRDFDVPKYGEPVLNNNDNKGISSLFVIIIINKIQAEKTCERKTNSKRKSIETSISF